MPVTNECPPLLKPSDLGLTIATSDVTLFDGNLSCVTVPPLSTLNEVLAILDAAICDMAIAPVLDASGIVYSGDVTCLTLVGVTVEAVIEELAAAICVNATAISDLATIVDDLCIDDIDLCSILNTDLYNCLFGSTAPPSLDPPNDNLASLLSLMLQKLCEHEQMITEGKSANDLTGSASQSVGYSKDLRSIVNAFAGDSHDFTEKGGLLTSSPSSFTPTIDDGLGGISSYYVNGWGIDKVSQTVTVAATSDNYIDVKEDGDYVISSVALAAPEPPVASDSYRLFKIVTDGSGVVSSEDRQTQYSLDGSTFTDDAILTRHISDGAITSDQLEDVVVGATVGDSDFFEITYDNKGRITAATADITITALADQDIMIYDLGSNAWINSTIAGSILPSGTIGDTLRFDGASWVTSGLLRNTGAVVGINVLNGDPLRELTLGYGSTFGLQLPQVQSFISATASGGALAANTYYYIITAIDTDGGESIISTETSATVDGVVTTAIDLNWASAPLAKSYKIYRGTATGVYVESQIVSATLFTDIDSGWGADVTPTHTDASSYSWVMTEDGLRIGDGDLSVSAFTANSGLGKGFAIMAEAGNSGFKDTIFISDDPFVSKSGFPTSLAFGAVVDRTWDGATCVHVFNDDVAGTSSIASVFVGSQDGAGGIQGEALQLGYGTPSYVRGGAPTTGVSWYQNKGLVNAGIDLDGLIISVNNPTADLHFEMDDTSRMLLENGGSLGLGLDGTGVTAVEASALFEMKSTTQGFLPPRMTGAQVEAIAPAEGLVAYATNAGAGDVTTKGWWGYNGSNWIQLG